MEMVNPYMKAPHADLARTIPRAAPNAALLIDFDNVTMGMRSDLAKELKHLLDTDIIKGKVTVQRAYADWRRYPQYIVPLSEASIDLIFAPAYGSSKKNATDIRMAIDGMELVFIRPEIGTFILLTGDSDFSSLVLKLKEYGKYVIGIGIQESSSDILVQNCDEYYSYTALTGLSKTSDQGAGAPDAWRCVEEALARMVSRGDVMRSDRLKQVIMELSPDFSERNLGFKNFSKFLVEAANKGLLSIERGQNGQYLVAPPGGMGAVRGPRTRAAEPAKNGDEQRKTGGRGTPSRRGHAGKAGRGEATRDDGARVQAVREPRAAQHSRRLKDPAPALELLQRAVRELGGKNQRRVRDSDAKRKMLAIDKDFHEGAYGFGKFSKFLQHAEGEGAIALERGRDGSYGVRLAQPRADETPVVFDVKALGLPTTESSIKSYLANRYKGIGVKTAARLVEHFGTDVFKVLHDQPDRVKELLLRARADSVLAAWATDYERRSKSLPKQAAPTRQASPSHRQASHSPKQASRSSRPAPSSKPAPRVAEAPPARGDAAVADPPAPDNAGEPAGVRGKPARSGLMGLLLGGRRSREGGGGKS